MGITIKDVAAVAGVSPATVSRFFTGNAKVAPETAEQIRAVIEELGYQPDHVARALRQKKSHLLGYVAPNLNQSGAIQLLAALEREAAAHGFLIAVASAQNLSSAEAEKIERLVSQGIDGLFLLPVSGSTNQSVLTTIMEDDTPVVQLGERIENVAADFVGVDYPAGMDAILRHLIRHQRSELAYIGPGAVDYSGEAQIKAILEAVRNNPQTTMHGIKVGGQTIEFGRQSTLSLLEQSPHPSAFICANNLIASGCHLALKQHNIQPSDVSVIVFGQVQPMMSTMPAVTVAALPYANIAQEAMRIMLQRISGLAVDPLQVEITPNLQVT